MLVNNLTTEVSPAKVYALLSSRAAQGSHGEGEELWHHHCDAKYSKNKNPKIQIYYAQNVGKVWIGRKNPPGPIWGHLGQFFAWAGKMEKM